MADVNQFSSLAGIAAEEEQIRKLREQRENDVRTLSSLVNAQQEGQNLEKDKASLLEKYNKLTEEAKSIGGILESGVEYQSPAGKMLYQAYNLPLKAAQAILPEGKLESMVSAAEAKPLNLSPESKLAYLNKLNSIDEQRLNIFEQLKKYSSDKQPALPASQLKAPESAPAAPQSAQVAGKTEDGVPVVKAERLTPFDEFNIMNQRRQQFIEDSMNDIASLPRGLRDRGMKLVKELADQSFKLPDNIARPVIDAATGQVIPGWRKVGDRLEKMGDETPKVTEKNLTAEQQKSLEFGKAMEDSSRRLERMMLEEGYNPASRTAQLPIPDFLKGSNRRRFEGIVADFATAQLRKTSGAQLTDNEFERAVKLFFPQPGDSPEVVREKAERRRRETSTILIDVPEAAKQKLETFQSQQQQQGGQGGPARFTRGPGGELIIQK